MSRDFEELFRLISVGTIFVTALLVLYMVILAFARDKIVRPRLFSWGAILFALAIIIPVIGLLIAGVSNAFSMGGGGRNSLGSYRGGGSMGDIIETVVLVVSLGVAIVTPLLLSLSILFGIIGLLPKFQRNRAMYALPLPQNTPPQNTPHPLD